MTTFEQATEAKKKLIREFHLFDNKQVTSTGVAKGENGWKIEVGALSPVDLPAEFDGVEVSVVRRNHATA